ncbi:MAG: ACT domain-containing protein [Candidatus Peregrinibacteria bacterium]|nr:ACT domain-containing protein [Candidatus Peregrinibacteria bacterium]
MKRVTQINVLLPNVPGSLATICDKLRAADVNLIALCTTEGKPNSTFHMVVDDTDTAKLVLSPLFKVTTNTVFCFEVKNKPGAIAAIGRTCAGAGVNIRNIYATTYGKEATVYVSVEDDAKAEEAFKSMKNGGS